MRLLKTIITCILLMTGFAGIILAGNPSEKQVLYLSGTDNINTKIWDFFCTGGRQSGYWTKIEVPSCWEQQGFGTYNYGRDSYTYGKTFKFADEKGLYKYQFQMPSDWKGKEIFI